MKEYGDKKVKDKRSKKSKHAALFSATREKLIRSRMRQSQGATYDLDTDVFSNFFSGFCDHRLI